MAILDQLPPPADRRLAVRLTPDALRQVRGGHPWVFDRSIASIRGERPTTGDLAVIFDEERRFAAIGLYDRHSPIRIRVLHHGRPTTIDADWWRGRLQTALDRRAELRRSGQTTGFRWVHGENDGMPGLVVDVYATTAVVKLYTMSWVSYLATIVPLLVELGALDDVVLRLSRELSGQHELLDNGTALFGEAPDGPVMFLENGLYFEADVVAGQKTGHFLDQRDNRALLRTMTEGARVLDVFASTGGFSVYAAAGGATEVTGIDVSAPTLAVSERNLGHNANLATVRACRHETIRGDAFAELERLAAERRRFNVVIVDPPSFASRASAVDRAERSYQRLTELALGVLERGGVLVQASCSSRVSPEMLEVAMTRGAQHLGYDLGIFRHTGHGVDHPIGFAEGEYLSAVFARPRRLPR